MPPFIDLTGKRFGRLTVLKRIGTSPYGQPRWACRCDCGKRTSVFGNALRTGITQSCGCLHLDAITTHGMTHRSEFDVWQMMIQRCENPNQRSYPRYGGRGIQVCKRWRASFAAFYADVGERPSMAHTLDRIDNDGDYTPRNCRWATRLEQAFSRSTTKPLTFRGETLSRRQWAHRIGVSKACLLRRLRLGWSIHDALTTKPR